MADWVRFAQWDFSLDDVRAVERLGGGTLRVHLQGVPPITLTASEGAAFLPRFDQFAKIEDLTVHFPDRADDD